MKAIFYIQDKNGGPGIRLQRQALQNNYLFSVGYIKISFFKVAQMVVQKVSQNFSFL